MQKWIKIFRKMQRPVIVSAFILCVLVFVYALVFSTDIYPLYYYANSTSSMYVPGAEVYYSVQKFNQTLLNLSIAFIVAGILLFVYFSQKRRIYYLSNYITNSLFAGFAFFMGIFIIANAAVYRAEFLQIDFAKLLELTQKYSTRYTDSTIIFDLGFVLGALLIISAALVVVNMLMRYFAIKNERREKQAQKINNAGADADGIAAGLANETDYTANETADTVVNGMAVSDEVIPDGGAR